VNSFKLQYNALLYSIIMILLLVSCNTKNTSMEYFTQSYLGNIVFNSKYNFEEYHKLVNQLGDSTVNDHNRYKLIRSLLNYKILSLDYGDVNLKDKDIISIMENDSDSKNQLDLFIIAVKNPKLQAKINSLSRNCISFSTTKWSLKSCYRYYWGNAAEKATASDVIVSLFKDKEKLKAAFIPELPLLIYIAGEHSNSKDTVMQYIEYTNCLQAYYDTSSLDTYMIYLFGLDEVKAAIE
jgi:hypothetical protein